MKIADLRDLRVDRRSSLVDSSLVTGAGLTRYQSSKMTLTYAQWIQARAPTLARPAPHGACCDKALADGSATRSATVRKFAPPSPTPSGSEELVISGPQTARP